MFMRRLALVAVLAIGIACGKDSNPNSPTNPSGPPEFIPAPADQAHPQTSFDGFITLQWQDVYPGIDVNWKVGDMTLIHVAKKNTATVQALICAVAVETADSIPPVNWNVTALNSLGGCDTLNAGVDSPRAVMGNYAQKLERVPWVRFVVWYNGDQSKGKNGADTGIKFRLGWNMNLK